MNMKQKKSNLAGRDRMSTLACMAYPHLVDEKTRREMATFVEYRKGVPKSGLLPDASRGSLSPLGNPMKFSTPKGKR